MSFPSTVLRRYRALSMIMVLNWMSSITRKASGTWSSDREEAMSAAALCFWGDGLAISAFNHCVLMVLSMPVFFMLLNKQNHSLRRCYSHYSYYFIFHPQRTFEISGRSIAWPIIQVFTWLYKMSISPLFKSRTSGP